MKTNHPAVTDPGISEIEPLESEAPTASSDPVVADEVGHPVGVGIGALSAGAAGAAIGAVAGPIGILVGAVVGAVAGGLVGEEVAAAGDLAETDNPDSSYTAPDLSEPTSLATQSTGYGSGAEPASGSLFSGADDNARIVSNRVPDLSGTRPPMDLEEAPLAPDLQPEPATLSEDTVRTSAYYRYVERETTGRPGDEVGDWVEAERELRGV
jgi:hypothetical protein